MTAPPRRLHPGAWWLWALALAAAATRATNPLLLTTLLATAGVVVAGCARRDTGPSAYGAFLKFGLVVLAIRVLFHVLLGGVQGPTVLLALPEVPLPAWAQGVRLGGPVTAEGLVLALCQGLQLAVLLACVGAANALADPKRLLRSLPAALYEVSVAVVVALTVAPQLVASARSVRRARLLRGDAPRGRRVVRSLLVPVLEEAFERSLVLAAAMDSRGYGRQAGLSRRERLVTGALVLGGLVGLCVGAYGLLGADTPVPLGAGALAVGVALASGGLALGSRRVRRTRYRPDRWRARELLVTGSGLVAAVCAFAGPAKALAVQVTPLSAPVLPLLPVAGALVALLPLVVAPAPPERRSS
ncbi:energy-coupling factor transporter transmembrane protein EcfT [Actinosynnema pretiosum subsp. pretiosum]|uniref:Cobalt transport protein n=2 Tax=Actinosynnema TaxID=40566 RepID=C6WII9_ACTMD|nr:CbiQ family ECF transporter T component [Actinosynnema mirum]ACU36232.1 cobalt transport protein [Actinosynnema mirum DSM 43827]AXX29686.1 Transmembrane component CbrV of energizing module of predicted cobalamin ECF transporter [Actinosynnema pretiosum subsp. pretiosum]QUF06089.1 energy-coupling factor transporter transmembrane protein EcfT [Actinosynnema pretiosum subsp. pretiosum]